MTCHMMLLLLIVALAMVQDQPLGFIFDELLQHPLEFANVLHHHICRWILSQAVVEVLPCTEGSSFEWLPSVSTPDVLWKICVA